MDWTEEQQKEIDKLINDATSPLQKELEETKAKLPKQPSDAEKALQEKEKELFKKQCSLTLKEKGLDKFDGIIEFGSEDDLNKKTDALSKIMNEIKVDGSYKPENHAQNNSAYESAKKKHDTVSMLKSLFK